jgi:transposase
LGKKAIGCLQGLEVRPCYRQGLDGYLRLAETVTTLIKEVTETIEGIAQDNPQATLLMTIPGISYCPALFIVSEIGDIEGFPSAEELCSYAGLVSSVHASGGKIRYGSITEQGSKWLRWILIELSYHFVRGPERG